MGEVRRLQPVQQREAHRMEYDDPAGSEYPAGRSWLADRLRTVDAGDIWHGDRQHGEQPLYERD